MKSFYERMCEAATYSKSEIEQINKDRLANLKPGDIYQPYIPISVYGYGDVVRPENE